MLAKIRTGHSMLGMLVRRTLCRSGIHYWQYMMAPPAWKIRDAYEPGIWCIFCGAKSQCSPGRVMDD